MKKRIVHYLYFIGIGFILSLILKSWIVESYTKTIDGDPELESLFGSAFGTSKYRVSNSAWDRIIEPFDEFSEVIFGDYFGSYLLIFTYLISYWLVIGLNRWKNQ